MTVLVDARTELRMGMVLFHQQASSCHVPKLKIKFLRCTGRTVIVVGCCSLAVLYRSG